MMDTNGLMPPTHFHKIGAQMRHEINIQKYPSALPPVKYFDVSDNGLNGLGASLEAPLKHQFIFEQSPEAFHGGVAVAVPTARHRWQHAELIEQFSEIMGAIGMQVMSVTQI